jgi:hypothetical protein
MKFMTHLLLIASLLTSTAQACIVDEFGNGHGLLPDNDMNIPVGTKSGKPGFTGGLTEEQFNDVITKLETIYKPIFEEKGFKFQVYRKWTDGTVNASAMRGTIFKNNRYVNMYGGLARHTATTVDGFALVLCHEIGHHLGGFPKVGMWGNTWASNEGQSDYYGANKCMKKLIETYPQPFETITADSIAKAKCESSSRTTFDAETCTRIAMAGKSLGDLFAALGNTSAPKFDTPDMSSVTSTNDAHPKAQCRLDTYFSGALCDKNFDDEIPNDDEFTGACTKKDGAVVGMRPLCWFKPTASL